MAKPHLVGGLEHVLLFHILGVLIPTVFHMVQRGGSTHHPAHDFRGKLVFVAQPALGKKQRLWRFQGLGLFDFDRAA